MGDRAHHETARANAAGGPDRQARPVAGLPDLLSEPLGRAQRAGLPVLIGTTNFARQEHNFTIGAPGNVRDQTNVLILFHPNILSSTVFPLIEGE